MRSEDLKAGSQTESEGAVGQGIEARPESGCLQSGYLQSGWLKAKRVCDPASKALLSKFSVTL
jgi:hypothetical protein